MADDATKTLLTKKQIALLKAMTFEVGEILNEQLGDVQFSLVLTGLPHPTNDEKVGSLIMGDLPVDEVMKVSARIISRLSSDDSQEVEFAADDLKNLITAKASKTRH